MSKQSIILQLNEILELLNGDGGILGTLSLIKDSLSEYSDLAAEAGEFIKSEDTLEGFATSLKDAESCLEGVKTSIDQDLLAYINDMVGIVESLDDSGEPVDAIDEVGGLIEDMSMSDDPYLRKKASALEHVLLTIGAKPNSENVKKAEDEEIDKLKKKYRIGNKDLYAVSDEDKKIKEEYIKEIEKKGPKKYKPLETSLSTRYSPNLPGVSLIRIADDVYQCPVTGEIFDYTSGFTTANGNKVPGTSVANQHQYDESDSGSMFLSTRVQRLSE